MAFSFIWRKKKFLSEILLKSIDNSLLLRNNESVLFLGRNKMRSSMNVHGVRSITTKVEPLEYGGGSCSTTKLVITGADGNEFTVTCFSDQPVAVESAPVESYVPAPALEEGIPA